MTGRLATLGIVLVAVAAPAALLASGRASAEQPGNAQPIPDAAFRAVGVPRSTVMPSPVRVGVEALRPAATPGPRPTPEMPDARPLVVVTATPKPAVQRPTRVATAATPSVADAKAYARSRIGSTQYACLDRLWTRESNWNPYAYNRSSGAYGIPQALPGDKMATFGSDWRTNPVTQVKWGLSYIANRYGSACNAWSHSQTHGWY